LSDSLRQPRTLVVVGAVQRKIAEHAAAERVEVPVDPELVGEFPGASIDPVAGEDENMPSGAAHVHDPAIPGQHRPVFRDRLLENEPIGRARLDHRSVVTGDA
jgi:hypothetical protein